MRFIFSLIIVLLFTSISNNSFALGDGPGEWVDPPAGMPDCSEFEDPPGNTACIATPICNLHGYCGQTSSSYSADYWSQLNNAFCGSIENNAFLEFIAEESSISFDAYVYNCGDQEAIQIMIFQASNCGSGPVTSLVCVNEMWAQNTPYSVAASGLTPGETYYIMIDGFAGHVCDYTFVATAGVAQPIDIESIGIELDENNNFTICVGETVTANATGGLGTYTWSGDPGLSTTTGANVTITPPANPGVYSYHIESSGNIGLCPGMTELDFTITVEVCNDDCNLSNLVADVGPCDLGTNTFDLSGSVSFVNQPTTGQLIIEDCNGNSQTFNAPFTSPTSFNITGITANGANCNLTAHFTAEPDCTIEIQNQNQDPCEPSCIIQNVSVNVEACVGGANSTTLTGAVEFLNPPSSGQLIVENCDGDSQTFNAPFTSPINYSIAGVNQNGQDCSVTAYFTADTDCTQTINYTNPVPGPTMGQITATNPSCFGLCDGELSATVNGGANPYSYSWQNTSTNSSVGSNSQDISGLCEGNYSLIVTDGNGCTTTGTSSITNPAQENITLQGNNPTCGNIDGQIVASGLTGNTSYQVNYQHNGNNVSQNITSNAIGNVIITELGQGAYNNFVITGPNGCPITNQNVITLVEPSPPVVVAPDDITICEGESVVLIAGNPNNATITWDNNVINGVAFTPSNTGVNTYTVTAHIDNCITTDQVNVYVTLPPEPSFTADVTSGCSPLKVSFTNTTTPSGAYCLWEFGDGSTSTGCGVTTHIFEESGLYDVTLTVTSTEGCVGTSVKQNYIDVKSSPIASFSANPEIATLSHPTVDFTNTSINAHSYLWDFGDDSPTSSIVNPTHKYSEEEDKDYIVTLVAYNADGDCTDTVRAVIKVIDELIYYVPNTFTPDGDDYNETFKPIFTSGFDVLEYKLFIYNRWGETLFESHNSEIGWDGTYNGQIIKDGTYIWKIEFKETMTDKHYTKMGHVTIIR